MAASTTQLAPFALFSSSFLSPSCFHTFDTLLSYVTLKEKENPPKAHSLVLSNERSDFCQQMKHLVINVLNTELPYNCVQQSA